ncbi:hypothetical protein OSH11_22045 [Kaistia dalseonensis]|uniref:LTXXQ motif family protein n=1 Tax=Kaistia dalseonensis TaxID=410840 RepID=A0ABU0HE68_9HYPH|nr:hypothetical protein [Kaistia dalseonensis]MCX5497396.1 hypothetical protein [Kaistia dalseonensis]MDQ0440035.1 hypothetical protein [Kaistia dalseonensis]
MKRSWKASVAALGLVTATSIAALTASAADSTGCAHGRPALPAPTVIAQADQGPAPGRPGRSEWPRMERPRPAPGMMLARQLAAAETLVGIRSEQLDAWRDYTDALLALLQPPPPPENPAPGAEAKAFARERQLINAVNDRAAKAATLGKAIEALQAKLSPDQLARLATVDLRMGPPHGRGPGFGPGRPGPGGPGFDRPGPDGPEWRGPGPDGAFAAPDGDDQPADDDQGVFEPGGPGHEPAGGPPAPQIPDEGVQPGSAPRPG